MPASDDGVATLSTDLAVCAAGVVADLEPKELALAGVFAVTLSLAAVGAFPDVGDVGAATSSAALPASDDGVATLSTDLAAVPTAGAATLSADLVATLAIFPSTTAEVVTGACTVTVLLVGLYETETVFPVVPAAVLPAVLAAAGAVAAFPIVLLGALMLTLPATDPAIPTDTALPIPSVTASTKARPSTTEIGSLFIYACVDFTPGMASTTAFTTGVGVILSTAFCAIPTNGTALRKLITGVATGLN